VTIHKCNPPHPTPPAPVVPVVIGFNAAGMEDSYFNLSDYYYFWTELLDQKYLKKDVLVFWREKGVKATIQKSFKSFFHKNKASLKNDKNKSL